MVLETFNKENVHGHAGSMSKFSRARFSDSINRSKVRLGEMRKSSIAEPIEAVTSITPKMDFTDIIKAKENQLIRKDYLDKTNKIEAKIADMKAKGSSSEEIANTYHTVYSDGKI